MKKEFYLTITGAEHGEWQGTLRGPDGAQAPFQSVLELLRALNDGVNDRREHPNWENGRDEA